MANPMTQLDPGQAIKTAFDDATGAFKTLGTSAGLITVSYDEIDLTYVASGNGVGQVQTAVYKASGTTVATLTLSYDSNNNLTKVVKT